MFETDEQRNLFTEILDDNYAAVHETDPLVKIEREAGVQAKLYKLRQLMGSNKFDEFIRRGREMFAPAKN